MSDREMLKEVTTLSDMVDRGIISMTLYYLFIDSLISCWRAERKNTRRT